jgi:hypothetical protein
VALGTPVYTTFEGRMGGVDEQLLRENRLRTLRDADAIELVKKPPGAETSRRDPNVLVDLMLS